MATPSIDQGIASSYEAVLNLSRKPENQWAENAFLRECERMGVIVKTNFGPTLEATLDYRRNPDAGFLQYDNSQTGKTKTEVIQAASFTPAQLSVPIVWFKMQEVQNPTENQKIPLIKSLITNALDSHDELIEEALFATSTQGFLGLQTLVPTSGQGSVGGIDASLEAWFRNPNDTYQADGSDIEAVFTGLFKDASKGSGSALAPRMMISGQEPHTLYEGNLQPLIRFADVKEGDAGFKVLAFNTARYSFSQFGDTQVYFLNPKVFQVRVAKGYFRELGEMIVLEDSEGFKRTVYSALQAIVNNKSRLAVASEA